MEDVELELLQLAHRASDRLFMGRGVTPLEELSLHAVVRMIEPILSPVEKSRTRILLLEISKLRTPATPTSRRFAGHFFR